MRALKRLRSGRSRLRSSFAAFAAALIFVASGVVGVLGFAGSATANPAETPNQTPVQDVATATPNVIDALGPFQDAIASGSSGAAANWAFDLNDNPSTSVTTSSVWAAGDQIVIDVGPPGSPSNQPWVDQDATTGDTVEFDGTPSVFAEGGASGATAPTFTVAVGHNSSDIFNDAGLTDQLVITFTNSASSTGLTPFTLAILGIKYTVGGGTPQGAITSTGFYFDTPNPPPAGVALVVQPNAAVIDSTATANAPAITVEPSAVNAPISPISVNELKPGQVGSDSSPGDESLASTGYICVTIAPSTDGEQATFVGSPTISVSGGTVGGIAQVSGVVDIINPSAASPALPGGTTLVTQVLDASSSATTFTFGNLQTDAPEALGPVTAEVTIDQNFNCTGGTPVALPGSPTYDYSVSGAPEITIYTVATGHGPKADAPIYGSTSEQTAVASLEYELPPAPLGSCLPNNANPHPRSTSFGSTVILTVDANDGFDSLAASYLASYYNTGVLLTEGANDATNANGGSINAVDPYTLNAIQSEGVTTVFIVGGVDAVSAADASELASTPSYECGGSVERTNALGQPIDLQVQRIWGQTADATAAAVADFVNSGNVGQLDLSGGFSGGYNDTLGTSSSPSPNEFLRTAILSTDLDSQDAESGSALSYFENIPLLLTPRESLGSSAETALLDLGIQQVIELGGPLAIDAPVNTALESQGISVLRIAGQDGSETSVQLADFELNTGTTSAGQPLGLTWGTEQIGGEDNCLPILDAGEASDPGSDFYSCSVTVALARGDFFADGVTSSVVTGQLAYPILLAESPSSLGTYLTNFFAAGGSPSGVDPVANVTDPFVPFQGEVVDDIVPFGGPLALNATTIQAALNAISAGANPPA